jgi:peptide/nickel transport system substrate-binding protein
MRTKLFTFFSLLIIASMALAACAPQTVVQTVVVPGATQVVTQIVAGTPQVQVVTATPAPAAPAKTFNSKDPTTWVTLEWGGGGQTMDPASDYETAGLEIIQNTYDYLFFFKKNLSTEIAPMIATEIPTVANGGISADGLTYTFKIRTGVKFHNGDVLTPHDVAFTLQRFILQGGSSSPAWIYVQPVLGAQYTDPTNLIDPTGKLIDDVAALQKADPAKLKAACTQVTDAIKADDSANTVTMKLAQPWGPLLSIMANFGAITDQKWIAANGGWDGSCDTWQKFYFPGYDAINKLNIGTQENGSGPFKIDHVAAGQEVDLVANPDYWVTTPLWDGGPTGAPKLQKVIIKNIDDFATRLATYQAGDADSISPGSRTDWPQLDTLAGATCDASKGDCQQQDTSTPDMAGLRLTNLPLVTHTEAWFTFDIDTTGGNNFIGSGKLDGNGIPANFFDDINIRQAFSQCFDFDTFIKQVYQGQATQVTTIMLPGEPGYDAKAPHYTFDKDKCTAAFKASTLKSADGKSLWDTGFRFTMAYNTGNTLRQTIGLIFQQDLAQINPKFIVDIEAIPWSAFLSAAAAHKLPVFVVGWQEDYPDPHDWVVPFASTGGNYSTWQNLPKSISATFDPLIQAGVKETDPTKRADIYKQFNQLFHDQATELPMVLATNQMYFQRWDNNVYTNPFYGWLYYYPFSKN